ncbi:unnamed protein product, partial [Schistosoma curassoni]|uniref:Bridge-like lipid transfer protein family member 1 C-terminal domain-containing protein n=1 Tax=Schistosoma curassoni TaxID=6186 RepID=A0A183L2L6_9TREM
MLAFSASIFDIGIAEFTCDTRRTLEILDIYNSWYRSSLARRLFLGNDELIETVNITTQSYDQDETMKATKTQNEQSDTKLGSTLSNDNLDTKQETSGSLEMPLQSGLINLST